MQFKTYLKINKKLILGFLIFLLSASNLYSIENRIILKIENKIITSLDLENEIRYLQALNPDIKNLDKKKTILIGKNSLIREKIKENELLKYIDKINLEQKFLDQLITERYSKLNLNNKKEFLDYLNNYKVDINIIEEKISIEALWNQLIYTKFSKKIKIDKKDLEIQIEKANNKDLKSYLLSEIVFEISETNNLDNKYNKIKNSIINDSFESAALTYSISSSAVLGGKLGWIKESSLNKTIKTNLSKLKINDLTKPIFTPNGYLILKIENIKSIKKDFDKKKELNNLIRFTTNQQLGQYSNIYYNRIKKDTNINEF